MSIVRRGSLDTRVEDCCALSFFCFCCPALLNSSWRKKYFVLQHGSLSIFSSESESKPEEVVSLYASAVVLPTYPKVTRPNVIEVLTPKRSVFIACDSQQQLQDWSIAIQQAAILETSGKIVMPRLILPSEEKLLPVTSSYGSMSTSSSSSSSSSADNSSFTTTVMKEPLLDEQKSSSTPSS
eukprot:TRINITY_DN476_c1_g1_i1.p1 TRINITY_DN476_c1_g1~~TRINITY_DN476_c1_g1_i1.p1  ORF type:complete len:182 (+),score=54.39 TRINITY_DN476_c1_g1_i1:23-568(+)